MKEIPNCMFHYHAFKMYQSVQSFDCFTQTLESDLRSIYIWNCQITSLDVIHPSETDHHVVRALLKVNLDFGNGINFQRRI